MPKKEIRVKCKLSELISQSVILLRTNARALNLHYIKIYHLAISIRTDIFATREGGGGGDSAYERLVVSLRSVNFGFWSHLRSSGRNAIIFNRESLVQGCTQKNVCFCVLIWSLLGVKKGLGHAQIGLLQGFNSKLPTSLPTPLICGVPPPPPPPPGFASL